MREIELKTGKIDLKQITGEDMVIDFSYKQTLLDCLNTVINNGISIEDVEKRINIRKKLHESKDIILLEEVDYEYLKKLVLEEKWKIADQVIVDYVNDIKNAKQVN